MGFLSTEKKNSKSASHTNGSKCSICNLWAMIKPELESKWHVKREKLEYSQPSRKEPVFFWVPEKNKKYKFLTCM